MSALIDRPPYGERDEGCFLQELHTLTQEHVRGCPEYARICGDVVQPQRTEDVPFLHTGVFKHLSLRTLAASVTHGRTLESSATSSGIPSRIPLDQLSSRLQSASSQAIIRDFVGDEPRPLVVLDDAHALRSRRGVSARVAAAMVLQPLATEMRFVLRDPEDPTSVDWEQVAEVLERSERLFVYGLTWVLWKAWGQYARPPAVISALAGRDVCFVHSGGWKKLEAERIDRKAFDGALLQDCAPSSRVIDFYGLVEQIGVIYPLCPQGYRHVPVWADVLVRDSYTLEPLIGSTGQLQLCNVLAHGAPYHNVLTEDLGTIIPEPCPCGRLGKRFELVGRIPKSELRGCANV